MNFKYQCKRFQRNHQLLNSTSQKILNVSFDSRENNHSASIISIDDTHNIINKTNNLSQTINVFERLDQLQSAIEFQRKQRFHEYNRLIKIIKQMECKHSSIIYDSEIKYFKSPPKPEIFYNTNNTLLKKVSTANFQTNKNGKQNKSCSQHKCQRNGLNLDQAQGNGEKKMGMEENRQILLNRYNPQKVEIITEKLLQQSVTLEEKSKIEQRINERLMKQIKILRQQVMGQSEKTTRYMEELIKNKNTGHQKNLKEVYSNTQRLQNIIQESQKNMMGILQKVIKQIQTVQDICQENIRTQLHNIFSQIDPRIKYVEAKTQGSVKSFQSRQAEKQVWKKMIDEKMEKIQKQMLCNNIWQNKKKQLQNYIKQGLQQFKNAPQNNLLGTNFKELNDKLVYIENRFFRSIDQLYSKMEIISSSLGHQKTQIMNLQSSTQTNLSIHSTKINQICQNINSKFCSYQRDRQTINQLERYRAEQIENGRMKQKNDQKKREKQRQFVSRMIDEKISNKVEIFRLVSSKQIHSKYEKMQEQIIRIISKHIEEVEGFMTKISDQESLIISKFIGNCGNPCQKININSKINHSTVLSTCSTNI